MADNTHTTNRPGLPIPRAGVFYLLGTTAFVALLAGIWSTLMPIWQLIMLLVVLILLIDALYSQVIRPPVIERQIAASLALGMRSPVTLQVTNPNSSPVHLELFDHFPAQAACEELPVSTVIEPTRQMRITYHITPLERGKLFFPGVQIRLRSVFGFWLRDLTLPVLSETRVYPNFAAISHYALLATDNNLSQLGIIKKRRRGEGQDFHQLREYREGDSLRQIDWKATARMQKIISREYQDERDQEIIFLLDCGQRMLAKDADLSHFDYTLNALLLLSYVALRQGDAVGFGTFATNGSLQQRWLAPRKGQQHIQTILNTVYDLQPGSEIPDYVRVSGDLMAKHKKRALIILLSNLRDEDDEELIRAVKLLRRRHLVLLASLQENSIKQLLENPVNNLQDALGHAAARHYLKFRHDMLEKLIRSGIDALDVQPDQLNVELINAYLGIKRSGML